MWVRDNTERDLHVETDVAPAPFSTHASPGATISSSEDQNHGCAKTTQSNSKLIRPPTHNLSFFSLIVTNARKAIKYINIEHILRFWWG